MPALQAEPLNSPLEKGRTPKARFRPRATVFNARFRPVSKADACEAGTRDGFSL